MTEARWQELYFKLVNETDRSLIEQETMELENALQERLGEIDPQRDTEEYPLLIRTIESVNGLKFQNLGAGSSSSPRSNQPATFQTPLYLTIIDLDHRYVEVSDDFCRLVGYGRHELIGRKYDELTAPNTSDIEAVFRMFQELGHMEGLWVLAHRKGARILVRYKCHLRDDLLIEGKLEPLNIDYSAKPNQRRTYGGGKPVTSATELS